MITELGEIQIQIGIDSFERLRKWETRRAQPSVVRKNRNDGDSRLK
jgi:hypothetical protein